MQTSFCQDIQSLTPAAWGVILLAFVLYASILPINNFTSDLLQVKFGLTDIAAGNCFGYIYAVSGLVLIVVGLVCDKWGHMARMQCMSALAALLGNLWWHLSSNTCV